MKRTDKKRDISRTARLVAAGGQRDTAKTLRKCLHYTAQGIMKALYTLRGAVSRTS